MKYPRFNSIEELKNFGLSMDEVQIFSDIDPNDGQKNVLLITSDADEDGKYIAVVFGGGEIGEYNDCEAKDLILGYSGIDALDLYFEGNFTKIKPEAFSSIPLKHCVLTESIEEIGEYAFKETELESIVIPEGLRYIRKGAFIGCEELRNIELPSTIETIEEDAFYGCGDIEIKINKPEGSVSGAPWRADDAKVIWAK